MQRALTKKRSCSTSRTASCFTSLEMTTQPVWLCCQNQLPDDGSSAQSSWRFNPSPLGPCSRRQDFRVHRKLNAWRTRDKPRGRPPHAATVQPRLQPSPSFQCLLFPLCCSDLIAKFTHIWRPSSASLMEVMTLRKKKRSSKNKQHSEAKASLLPQDGLSQQALFPHPR